MIRKALSIAAAALFTAGGANAQPPDSWIDRALAHPEFAWASVAADGIHLYYQPGSFAERHRIMLLRSAEGALADGLAFLEMEPDGRPIRVLYVDDRAQMNTLIGHPYTGFAVWRERGVFLACNPEWRSFDTHEIAHVLSLGRWGEPHEGSAWMIEGLPIAVDGWCRTADVDRIAAHLAAAGRWPGLGAFLEDASSLGEVPGGVFAASLIRHLRGRYGAAILEETWRRGLGNALETRGLVPARVEGEWLDALRALPDPIREEEWARMDEDGCG